VAPADFDFGALKFRLGLPGRQALARIEGDEALAGRAEVAEQLQKLAKAEFYYEWSQPLPWLDRQEPVAADLADLASYMTVWPEDMTVPPEVLRQMNGNANDLMPCLHRRDDCALLRMDTDGNGEGEYLFLSLYPYAGKAIFIVPGTSGKGDWMRGAEFNFRFEGDNERDRLLALINRGEFSLEEPRYKNVRLGDLLLVPNESTKLVK